MKHLSNYINVRKGNTTIKATNDTITQIVKDELDRLGHDANLNHIDVSEMTNMDSLFSCYDSDYLGTTYSDLNPDISKWNVSNVENMNFMFYNCEIFNCDISGWDVSNVIDMRDMFYNCKNFNQDLSNWDVNKVKNMNAMFYHCENFNQDISGWDVSNVKNMSNMFFGCKRFNQDLSQWDVSPVVYMVSMFVDCPIEEKFKPIKK